MSSRPSFQKLQRERHKKAKAAAKRARRQGRTDDQVDGAADASTDTATQPAGDDEVITPDELLARVESLQSRLERGVIGLDEYEEEKAVLAERLASMPQ